MRILLITALAVALGSTAFATPQYPDKIIYKGKKYELLSNPLESYYREYPDKRPRFWEFTSEPVGSSALSRGYVATFEIKNNQLYLKDMEIQTGWKETKWTSVMHKAFPMKKSVKADWATEFLVLPAGKFVTGMYGGYLKVYDNYIFLEVENGHVTKVKTFKNPQEYAEYKERLFEVFKKTDAYKKKKKQAKKYAKWSRERDADSWMKNYILNCLSELLVD